MSKSRFKKIIFVLCLITCICLASYIFLTSFDRQAHVESGDTLSVTVLDVGQGESILITLGEDTMLIDAGQNSAPVLEGLQKRNISDIDVLIATHPHDDHIGGIKSIIEIYDIGVVYMADTESDTKTYKQLTEIIDDRRIPLKEAYAGAEFNLGSAVCTIVSPDRRADYDANNESVAVFVDYYSSEFIFTGDMEKKAEKALISSGYYIDADVLKAAHHGSSTGSTEAFLEAVSPQYAAISCGEGNSYGHPHEETLDLFESLDVQVFRTDLSGDITFLTDGKTINVVREFD